MMTEARKSSWALIGSLTAWLLTFGTLVWHIAVKDATYSSRITAIESDINELDARLDEADVIRLNIATDLAGIKTDLTWIRYQLEKMSSE
jgi:septal ring factor EnvC (AmiA/AmiB activator)